MSLVGSIYGTYRLLLSLTARQASQEELMKLSHRDTHPDGSAVKWNWELNVRTLQKLLLKLVIQTWKQTHCIEVLKEHQVSELDIPS